MIEATGARAHGEREERVTIDGDISGEQIGDRIVVLDKRAVPLVPQELLRAAHEQATELFRHAERIVEAFMDATRKT